MVVAACRVHLERRVLRVELEHRDVERTAPEVEDEDLLILLLVEVIGERSRGRLVDDAKHVEAGDLAGVLRRLALRVVEVGRDGDHRVGHRLAEVRLGIRLQLLQDDRADLRRRVVLAVGLHADVVVRALDDLVGDDLHLLRDLVELAAHEALDREDGVLWVRHLLPLRGSADEPLIVLRESDDRRSRPAAFGVRDDGGLTALDHGHTGVGRAEIDANDLCHICVPPYLRFLPRIKSKCFFVNFLSGAEAYTPRPVGDSRIERLSALLVERCWTCSRAGRCS